MLWRRQVSQFGRVLRKLVTTPTCGNAGGGRSIAQVSVTWYFRKPVLRY